MCRLKFIGLPMLCISLVAYFSMTSGALADAQSSIKLPAPVIAIVDVQRIMQESLAAKSMQKQLEAQRSKFQNEIAGEEDGLREAEQDLAKERDKLEPQAYADREQQLRRRFSTVENHVQVRRKALDQSFSDSMNAVHNALLEVVDQVAHEHGANIVIVKQQALWTDQPLDMTDEVLHKLDLKMPQIKVTMPAETPEANSDHD